MSPDVRSYVVRNHLGQGLERRGFDGRWSWTNTLRFATPLTRDAADRLADRVAICGLDDAYPAPTRVVPDYHNRFPEAVDAD